MAQNEQLKAYISQLSPIEQTVLQIASSHLETSFSLVKSIGFQEWHAEQLKAQPVLAQPVLAQPVLAQPVLAEPRKIKIKIKKKLEPTKS
jgi:hypothetical protein